jgi:hypothetical protein
MVFKYSLQEQNFNKPKVPEVKSVVEKPSAEKGHEQAAKPAPEKVRSHALFAISQISFVS